MARDPGRCAGQVDGGVLVVLVQVPGGGLVGMVGPGPEWPGSGRRVQVGGWPRWNGVEVKAGGAGQSVRVVGFIPVHLPGILQWKAVPVPVSSTLLPVRRGVAHGQRGVGDTVRDGTVPLSLQAGRAVAVGGRGKHGRGGQRRREGRKGAAVARQRRTGSRPPGEAHGGPPPPLPISTAST